MYIQDELTDDILRDYILTFLSEDLFLVDSANQKVYQKYNPVMKIVSEMGTINLNYILNVSDKVQPKVNYDCLS